MTSQEIINNVRKFNPAQADKLEAKNRAAQAKADREIIVKSTQVLLPVHCGEIVPLKAQKPKRTYQQRERALQKAILLVLRSRGWVGAVTDAGQLCRAQAAAGRPIKRTGGLPEGWPDLAGCYRGLFVAVECKALNKVQTLAQRYWEAQIKGANGYYVLTYTVETVTEFLNWLDRNVKVEYQ